jgi:tetratricopeptide (TPR) repeat protein
MPEHITTPTAKSLEDTYLGGQYDQAIRMLLEAKDQYPRGQFHYNLGTMHAKQGDLPVARFHLEKSIRLGFTNPHSWHNLEHVREKLEVDDLSTSEGMVDKGMEHLLALSGSGMWCISLVLMVVAVYVAKKKWVEGRARLVLLAVLALAPGLGSELALRPMRMGVALKDAQVHEGPSAIYQSKTELKAGSKFIIGQVKDGWSFIARPISISGWVNNQDLGIY